MLSAYFHGKLGIFSYVRTGELCLALAPGVPPPPFGKKGWGTCPRSYGPDHLDSRCNVKWYRIKTCNTTRSKW